MMAHAWLVTALNPKSITFFVAFLPQFLDRHADFWTQMLIFEATFLALAFANAFGYALVAARARDVVRNPQRDPHLQPHRRHAAGRRRHRHGRDALRRLTTEPAAVDFITGSKKIRSARSLASICYETDAGG